MVIMAMIKCTRVCRKQFEKQNMWIKWIKRKTLTATRTFINAGVKASEKSAKTKESSGAWKLRRPFIELRQKKEGKISNYTYRYLKSTSKCLIYVYEKKLPLYITLFVHCISKFQREWLVRNAHRECKSNTWNAKWHIKKPFNNNSKM